MLRLALSTLELIDSTVPLKLSPGKVSMVAVAVCPTYK
jgi:hypothetical protein